ncbi:MULTISPECIES: XrtA/PEP-CTERM system exopolysaccharide export protein [Cellvibrio]|jgi:polysaccharide export outer membrane protein|uniref:Polysaccharide export outer membrane protein n=1 Tax=Cellvibrio fibrivorans TaxID=126350 RepID=A0ABU1UU21_9GAMM|nr:XrtA/PEP-CTERM system exopolysaccharide export protein [Cellvibrio fibrivorans]MDR7088680.1 polysaccharide export outer membrane protein [Cellvibrio fibrivorans]
MKKCMAAIGVMLAVFILSACSNNKAVSNPEAADAAVLAEYRIGVGDALSVNVWRNPEMSLNVPVRPDGKISMPLIGDIMAADLTTEQLSQNITKSLTTYIRSPQVTVIVTNPSSSDFQRRVRITGAVASPQSIPYREGMTVLDLVLLAGGPNQFASANKAKLYRKVNNELKVYPIKLDDLINDGDVATNYTLQPSDIVTVPERNF